MDVWMVAYVSGRMVEARWEKAERQKYRSMATTPPERPGMAEIFRLPTQVTEELLDPCPPKFPPAIPASSELSDRCKQDPPGSCKPATHQPSLAGLGHASAELVQVWPKVG